MSLPTDYIFKKPLDKCVVIIVNILTSSEISIEFMMRNSMLAPQWSVLSSTRSMPSFQTQTWSCFEWTLSSWLSSLSYVLPWSNTILYIKNVVSISPPLKNSWYSGTFSPSPFFLVLFLTGIPTNGLWCVKFKNSSNPIALTLMVDSFILSLLLIESSFKHWSCYLVQIFGCTFQPMFNCVCFLWAYIIISFDLTNVISLFT